MAYKSRLVVFPKKASKPKNGDSTPEDISKVQPISGAVFPISSKIRNESARKISEEEKEGNAYATLRKAWGIARYHGIRAKRAVEKAESEAAEP